MSGSTDSPAALAGPGGPRRRPGGTDVARLAGVSQKTVSRVMNDEAHVKEEVRQRILASIARIAKNTALAAGIPEALAPIVKVSDTEVTPATYNDPKLTERLAGAFEKTLGASNVVRWPPIMGSEDFGNFSLDNQIPSCMFWLGAVEPTKVETSKTSGKPLPSLHSSLFEPLPEPTLRTGVKAMTTAVLELMKK